MKKYFGKAVLLFYLVATVSRSDASDFLVMYQDVTRDGELDEIKLLDNGGPFYTLSVVSKGEEILHNEKLIPKIISNKGGLDIFQEVSVTDHNISIRYRFCSPSSSICYDRNLVGVFKGEEFILLKEEVVAAADKISLSDTFYQKTEVLLNSLSYESLIENNENAEMLFGKIYGSCVAGLGGDALMRISEELENNTPDEWIMKNGCVTPALVFNLEALGYLSYRAVLRYLSVYEKSKTE
ncbi:hypothetical protein PUN49_20775 [Pseudomonas extremaustralis]|uniref:hypothetical protein n=1 Tax=Pseudomonas extremaustralis TaxID=359110 RepID=UPI0021C8F0A2|nr:hypothetical protein [Pseudomonas extremaustralis]MDG2969458.1 hypothetical protein [Pseudomonas extremaustralis]UUJ40073.1 hypothetical protein L1A22_25880 [Pseudomonas extremaustralis]